MLPEQRRYLEVFGNEMPPQSATKVNKKLDCIMDEELQEKDAFSKKINSKLIYFFYITRINI